MRAKQKCRGQGQGVEETKKIEGGAVEEVSSAEGRRRRQGSDGEDEVEILGGKEKSLQIDCQRQWIDCQR